MPLSKRRRLFTPKKHKTRAGSKERDDPKEKDVATARGRLKGALREMLEPPPDDSDDSSETSSPAKQEGSTDQRDDLSDDEYNQRAQKQSYVLKLFDRSVDLSQFNEDSPLYPICRAWIRNQPKANYKDFGKQEPETPSEESIDLPGPVGPPISRIPDLIPQQKRCSKDNINLNYNESPPPTKDQLLQFHMSRWGGVRAAWLQRAALVEARYSDAQAVLNRINVNSS